MPLSNPFVVYGKLFNSFTSEYVGNVDITIKFESGHIETVKTDNDGFYQLNIQPYANNEEEIVFECVHESWAAHHIYVLDIYDLSHEQNIILDIELANLKITYGDEEDKYFFCWCSDWSVRNQDFTIVTTLNKTQMEYLRNNCVPGAFISRKVIGYGYMNYDGTFDGSNTFKFTPYATLTSKLHLMRRETEGIVKNISVALIPNTDKYIVRIECITKTFM